MTRLPIPANALWTAEEAAAAVSGTAAGRWVATGVSIDSRTICPGDLFIALAGPTFDGHDFVADALARGAVAAMVHRPPRGVRPDAPLLAVEDTMEGLTALGAVARHRIRGRIAAITGSVGKTGTKEALRLALEDQGRTFASAGNLNNQWGVPLSLARMPPETAYGVFELGMNHAGEIAPLSRLVKPDVAVITTVEAVHLEFFDGIEQIADAKAEVFAGMGPAGVAILNRDNDQFARLLAHARTQGIGRIWSFGRHPKADARLADASLHATCSAVSAAVLGESLQFSLSAPGEHWVMNSLAVLLAVRALGADAVAAARTFSRLAPLKGRGARSRVRLPARGRGAEAGAFLLIDESYNASPASTEAAIAVLGRADPGQHGRRIAVLGDMLELGDAGPELHLGLKEALLAAEVDLVFAVGPMMTRLSRSLPAAMRAASARDSATLAPALAEAVRPGDVVMVKGSLGMRMASVIAALEALGEQREAAARPAGRAARARGAARPKAANGT